MTMVSPSFWSAFWRRAWRWSSVLLASAMLVGAIAYMAGAFHSKVPPGVAERQPLKAEGLPLAEVQTLETTESIDAVGTVQPRRKMDVASQVLATIREVKVNPGDRVEAGQLLVVLDDREMQAHLREAESAALGARADLNVRERERARYEQLLRSGAGTQEDFDRVDGAYKVALTQLKRVEEQVGRIKVMLSYTEIRAQSAGIVADRYVDPGDLAVPGKPLLTLHDPKERELHANVPESLARSIHLGMELPVRVDAVDRDCHGVVREIVPQAQQASRSVLVKVTLPPEAVNVVYIGMFGRLSIPTGRISRIVVPAAAVQYVGQQELVDVVGADGTLERRFVRTGRRVGEKIEILSGLAVGEKVAISEGIRPH